MKTIYVHIRGYIDAVYMIVYCMESYILLYPVIYPKNLRLCIIIYEVQVHAYLYSALLLQNWLKGTSFALHVDSIQATYIPAVRETILQLVPYNYGKHVYDFSALYFTHFMHALIIARYIHAIT